MNTRGVLFLGTLGLGSLGMVFSCGEDEGFTGPCFELNLCCDALISNPVTPLSCVRQAQPTEDAACDNELEILQILALPGELPEACERPANPCFEFNYCCGELVRTSTTNIMPDCVSRSPTTDAECAAETSRLQNSAMAELLPAECTR